MKVVGEPDTGKPYVRFDEGVQETCFMQRACALLYTGPPESTHTKQRGAIVSWLLLIICSFLVIHGALLLRMVGKPDGKRSDPSLIGIEKATELVTVGAYRYIRHPIYSSLLFLAWGVFFKHTFWLTALVAVVTTFFLTMTAKREEDENLRFFGEAYQSYYSVQ